MNKQNNMNLLRSHFLITCIAQANNLSLNYFKVQDKNHNTGPMQMTCQDIDVRLSIVHEM